MEQVLVDLISEDEGFENFVDRYIGFQVEMIRRTLAAAKGGIDFLWIGEDLGTQAGPMINVVYRGYHSVLRQAQDSI